MVHHMKLFPIVSLELLRLFASGKTVKNFAEPASLTDKTIQYLFGRGFWKKCE